MKNTKNKTSYLYWFILLAGIFVVANLFAYVHAYFTASASKKGDITFHDINLELTTANSNNALFTADVEGIVPGDLLDVSNVTVKNSGTADVYTLVNFNIYITREGYTDCNIDYWYNLQGSTVKVEDMEANTTKATSLAVNGTQTLNFSHRFDGAIYDNTFAKSNVSVTVRAMGIQTQNLESIGTITDSGLIAAAMLVEENYTKQASSLADYNALSSVDSLNCTTPTKIENGYSIYSMSVENTKAGDTFYVQAKDAEMVMIAQGNHTLNTMLNNTPAGTVQGNGQAVTTITVSNTSTVQLLNSRKITPVAAASTTTYFTVVAKNSSSKAATVRIYKTPKLDLPSIVDGKGMYNVTYADLQNGVVSFDTALESTTYNGQDYEMSNFKLSGFTENCTVYYYVELNSGNSTALMPYNKNTKISDMSGALSDINQLPANAIAYNCGSYFSFAGSLEITTGQTLNLSYFASVYEPYAPPGFDMDFSNYVNFYLQPEGDLPIVQDNVKYFPQSDGTYLADGANALNTDAYVRATINGKPVELAFGAFGNCVKLKNVTFEENPNLTKIDDYCFDSCTSLTEITIPASVERIGYAFMNCSNLTTINLPQKDGYMWLVDGKDASTLTQAQLTTYAKQGSHGFTLESVLSFSLSADKTYYIVTGLRNQNVTAISIPSTYNGLPVKEIGDNAFAHCDSLTTVTFAEDSQLTTIGNSAFLWSTSLTEITIPASVTTIGNNAFACTSFTTINLEDCLQLTIIGYSAFSGIESLTEITIPASVTTIGDYAFDECTSLTTVNFESNSQLTTIGGCAFSDCTNLTTVNLGVNSKLRTIGNDAFSYTAITEITIPSRVTMIGGYAFSYCENLTTVTFGNRVTVIGREAFYRCTSLTTVTFGDSPWLETIEDWAFSGCSSLTTITIPSSVTYIGKRAFSSCSNLETINLQTKENYVWKVYNNKGSVVCADASTLTQEQLITYAKGDYYFEQVRK